MKLALVTGANRGLGRAVAEQLARDGLHVIVASRRGGADVVAALQKDGLSAEHQQLDVADEASIAALAASLRGERVGLDVLVNNAGVALDGFDADGARRTVDVNCCGPLRVTDALTPCLRDGANVVMVSSGMGELSGSRRLSARASPPRA